MLKWDHLQLTRDQVKDLCKIAMLEIINIATLSQYDALSDSHWSVAISSITYI